MTKINSVRRAFGLWCAFLAAGTWVLPMGVVVGPSSRATAAPLVAIPEGECDSIVVVFTAGEPTVEVEEFGKSIAAQGASAAPPALVVLSPVSEEVAEQLSAAALAEGGQQGLIPLIQAAILFRRRLSSRPGPEANRTSGSLFRELLHGLLSGFPKLHSPLLEADNQAEAGMTSMGTGMWITV